MDKAVALHAIEEILNKLYDMEDMLMELEKEVKS